MHRNILSCADLFSIRILLLHLLISLRFHTLHLRKRKQYKICASVLISKLADLAENFSWCLKHLSCREPVSVCFCGREIHRGGYLKSFKST